MGTTTGLRERKKEKTRAQLTDAALAEVWFENEGISKFECFNLSVQRGHAFRYVARCNQS